MQLAAAFGQRSRYDAGAGDREMQENNVIPIVIVLVVAVLVGFAAWAAQRARRRRVLAQKYGAEYERILRSKGDPALAQRELEEREKRVGAFKLRQLSADQRERHFSAWSRIQAAFVDEPARAAREAHQLLMTVMRDRGYPDAELAQRQRDLSVHYPELLDPYREACEIAARSDNGGGASTEDLRRATVCYRSLLTALLDGASSARESRELQEVSR
jgi:hypothetical protein